jgi:C-terminal processing protease CtpA/Prc
MPKVFVSRLLWFISLCLVTVCAQERPQPLEPGKPVEREVTGSQSQLTERLAGLGQLWGAVKFFHPALAYQNIDWDSALVKVIPLVKAARTADEYRQAVNVLLQVLNDPVTIAEATAVVGEHTTASAIPETGQALSYFSALDDYIVVKVTDWVRAYATGNGNAAFAKQAPLLAEVGKAKGVVFDCRYNGLSQSAAPSYYLSFNLETNLLPGLLQGLVPLGTRRYRQHTGYAPQQVNSLVGYTSTFLTVAPNALIGRARETKPLAVLLDEQTPDILALVSGLQAAGAKVVQVGKSNASAGVQVHRMKLPDGVRVNLRLTEFVHPNGSTSLQPDVQLSAEDGAGDKGIAAALAALNAPASEKARQVVSAFTAQTVRDNPYPQMSFPTEEYRLLALFRIWNVINYFYPHKHLTDKPWSTVLSEYIPRMLECKSALDYATVVAELSALLQDTHGWSVTGLSALENHLGVFAPPLRLSSAGGKLVVLETTDAAVAQAAGLKRGDVILTIDGEPAARRIAALARLRSLSTPQSAYAYVYPTALRGAKDSQVKLQVEGVDGQTREVELAGTTIYFNLMAPPARRTPVYQVLPNGYGYIDLARLPAADAPKALEAVLSTPAVIFDMRGYPLATTSGIAAHLTEKKNVTAALLRRPLQSPLTLAREDSGGSAQDYYIYEQKLPAATGAPYKGKVVMLINEHSISAAEHTCLAFEAATSVTFIGGPTVGANGEVSNLALPGGIYITFTGSDVRHADGRQLQRAGIQPHIKIEPTAKGISEGRDEVLEAALKHLDRVLKQ